MNKQRYALPENWVKALREDAPISAGGVARDRLGISQRLNVVYVTFLDTPRRKRCMACGKLISLGEQVVHYQDAGERGNQSRTRYIHWAWCP